MGMLEDLTAIAKQNLEKDGYVAPIFFLADGEELVAPPTLTESLFKKELNADDAKSFAVFSMGVLARVVGANRIIMIWDAAFRTVEKIDNYDATEAPLTFPKSMRTECLVIYDLDLQSGKDTTQIIPYKGGDGQPVEFLPSDSFKGMAAESRFTELALEGYNKGVDK